MFVMQVYMQREGPTGVGGASFIFHTYALLTISILDSILLCLT